jgi:CDK-activating kinase assembly factor MAT1
MNLSEEDLIDSCVQCGKRQNAVSNLTEQVFQVNTANKCGHKFCSSCVERELYKKRQFACPRCKNMVSRDKLSTKSLDETEVERDFSIRRKVKALYNKVESDFQTVDEFKNYEEMVEDIIYNLVNLIDVENTNQLIEKYKQENAKEILVNQFRRKEEQKGESVTIKEKEEAILVANKKYEVRTQPCCRSVCLLSYMLWCL